MVRCRRSSGCRGGALGEVRRASVRTRSIGDTVEDADDEHTEPVAPTCMIEWTGHMQCVVAAGNVRCARAVQRAACDL